MNNLSLPCSLPVVGRVVGLLEGAVVGLTVGAPLGAVVGRPLGAVLGKTVGAPVGAVGVWVGCPEGKVVGLVVGTMDGLVLGLVLGIPVGAVGATLGDTEGPLLGPWVGYCVGMVVGRVLGLWLGSLVGAVGSSVGWMDGLVVGAQGPPPTFSQLPPPLGLVGVDRRIDICGHLSSFQSRYARYRWRYVGFYLKLRYVCMNACMSIASFFHVQFLANRAKDYQLHKKIITNNNNNNNTYITSEDPFRVIKYFAGAAAGVAHGGRLEDPGGVITFTLECRRRQRRAVDTAWSRERWVG